MIFFIVFFLQSAIINLNMSNIMGINEHDSSINKSYNLLDFADSKKFLINDIWYNIILKYDIFEKNDSYFDDVKTAYIFNNIDYVLTLDNKLRIIKNEDDIKTKNIFKELKMEEIPVGIFTKNPLIFFRTFQENFLYMGILDRLKTSNDNSFESNYYLAEYNLFTDTFSKTQIPKFKGTDPKVKYIINGEFREIGYTHHNKKKDYMMYYRENLKIISRNGYPVSFDWDTNEFSIIIDDSTRIIKPFNEKYDYKMENYLSAYCDNSQLYVMINGIKNSTVQVIDLDIEILRLKRNMVFAKYGREFKTKKLSDFFKKQSWYKIKENYHDGLLTDEDKELINKYVELENIYKNSN